MPDVVTTIKLPKDILQSYTGEYELKPGFVFTVTFGDGGLFCQPTGQPKLELLPVTEYEFILKEVDAKITFSKDSNQKTEKLILSQGGNQFPAIKIK